MSRVEIFWIPLALDVYITFSFHAAVKIRRKKRRQPQQNIFSRSLKRSSRFFFFFIRQPAETGLCCTFSHSVRSVKGQSRPLPLFIQPFHPFVGLFMTPPPKKKNRWSCQGEEEELAAGGQGWTTRGTEEGGWEEKVGK